MTFKILTMTAALGLAASGATAQTNGWLTTTASYTDDYQRSYADARQSAYQNGDRDGVKRGEQAARDRQAFNVERERDYRDAESGYNRSYGDRNRYRDDYRGGFAQGYREGYYQRGAATNGSNGRYDNSGTYRNYGGASRYGNGNAGYGAFQNGAADGYRKALEDIDDRKYPDATRHKWYRSGDHEYDKAYGSKDAYKVEYRRGFQEGYNRAFREGRR